MPLGASAVNALVIGPQRGIAWILRNAVPGTRPGYEVRRADSTGRTVLASTGVAPKSLALTGSRISWWVEQQAQTATVQGPYRFKNPAATGDE